MGNSASVRIPAAIMEAAHLDLDDAVDVREESGRIVIEPAQRKEYDLTELVKGITRENCMTRRISANLLAKRCCNGAALCARRWGHSLDQLRPTDWT